MKTYLVEKTNQLLELISLKEIHQRLQKGLLNPDYRIYDETVGGWIQLSKHPTFQFGKTMAFTPATTKAPTRTDGFREWYYLQGNAPIGAFTHLEMIRMIQNKKIDTSAIVWRPGLPNWAPASLLNDFQSNTIQQILASGVPSVKHYFQKRRHARFPYEAKFILHNEEKLWKGTSIELGPGGIGLIAQESDLKIGQEVFLQKTSRGGGLSVNAVAIVRSKTTTNMISGQAKFGLEFIDISREEQIQISQLGRTLNP